MHIFIPFFLCTVAFNLKVGQLSKLQLKLAAFLLLHVQPDTKGDCIASEKNRCLDVLVSPNLFSCQRVVNPACCLHLLAAFAFLRIIYYQINGFPFLGPEGIEQFVGLLRQCVLRVPSTHIEKIVESCSVVKEARVQLPTHCSNIALLPYKGNQQYKHFKIFEVPRTEICFQRAEKVVEFGGKSYDLKHEGKLRCFWDIYTYCIGCFAFLFDIFPLFTIKSKST